MSEEVCARHREALPCAFCLMIQTQELLSNITQDVSVLLALNEFLASGSINKVPPLLAPGEMSLVMLRLGPKLFEFHDFDDWVARARHLYARGGYTSQNTLAIDQHGRIVDGGADMRRAQQSNAFPINVYDRKLTVS